jgi:hypothetical protein
MCLSTLPKTLRRIFRERLAMTIANPSGMPNNSAASLLSPSAGFSLS